MALETNVILKSILQNLYLLDNIEDARESVAVLLTKEESALVREQAMKIRGEALKREQASRPTT